MRVDGLKKHSRVMTAQEHTEFEDIALFPFARSHVPHLDPSIRERLPEPLINRAAF